MDTLRKCLKINALRQTIRSLPKTLDDTYGRILMDIGDDYSEDAIRVLQMLCFSCRPILLPEIVDVLAIELQGHFQFDPQQRLPHPRDIKLICSTLIDIVPAVAQADLVDEAVEELKFAHYSVKEYLISGRATHEQNDRYSAINGCGNVSIAQICLTYLLYFDDPELITSDILERFPFYRYAAKYWIRHYELVNDPDCTEMCIELFTSKRICFENLLRIYDPDKTSVPPGLYQKPKSVPRLYYASLYGLSDIVELLLQDTDDINTLSGTKGSALHTAAYHGHTEVIHSLLEHGADVNVAGGRYDHALVEACENSQVAVIRLLLEHGVDINQSNGKYGSALYIACKNANR